MSATRLVKKVPIWLRMILVLMVGALLGACIACNVPKIKGFRPDAPAEELFEEMIEKYSGIDLDLSPLSPEHV